jgi:hypothetical protein
MLLTQKPCIFAANVGEDDLADQGASRGLHSSTFQLNPSRFGHIPCLIDGGKTMHPTYPTKCAYVELNSGRV